MTYISKLPLSQLVKLLDYAYDREIYERWLTIYPLMEAGLMEYISFEKYKEKLINNSNAQLRQSKLTDEEIINEMNQVIKWYEQKQEAGEK